MSKENFGIVKVWEATVRKSQAIAKKRTTMSVAHADDDEPGPGQVYDEKVLSNGDFYTGQWVDNVPSGHGKYLWTDGCMYVGE
jgi:1-phosphatidylinositol-4-phosphate 5-kinase